MRAKHSKYHSKRQADGFTLLEILVALAIAAIGVIAVMQTTGAVSRSYSAAEQRIYSTWIASNRLAELRLGRAWRPAATTDQVVVFGGRNWYVRDIVTTTADPDVQRVDVRVYADPAREQPGAEVFGYLARYSPPVVSTQ